eukprot:GHVL01035550.1.p1 GENE.GHVL01035550.1~~GHVL01035550.1.p1  ORF type:complete len:166 (+),score=10.30 GHVL01035550.1:2791-3288(+)
MTISGFIYYNYVVELHMNGRLMDVYHRLTGDMDSFFIPHDTEISHAQMSWICSKARKWEGMNKEVRKIIVTHFTITDSKDPSYRENSSHVSIYTHYADGTKSLFRHFVRFADGAICEIAPDTPLPLPNTLLLKEFFKNILLTRKTDGHFNRQSTSDSVIVEVKPE